MYSLILQVFGALTSCALHPSEHFYGTGESLLFSFQRVLESRRTSQAPPQPAAATTTPAAPVPVQPTTDTIKEKDSEHKDGNHKEEEGTFES